MIERSQRYRPFNINNKKQLSSDHFFLLLTSEANIQSNEAADPSSGFTQSAHSSDIQVLFHYHELLVFTAR